jgi:hypothetical protein
MGLPAGGVCSWNFLQVLLLLQLLLLRQHVALYSSSSSSSSSSRVLQIEMPVAGTLLFSCYVVFCLRMV